MIELQRERKKKSEQALYAMIRHQVATGKRCMLRWPVWLLHSRQASYWVSTATSTACWGSLRQLVRSLGHLECWQHNPTVDSANVHTFNFEPWHFWLRIKHSRSILGCLTGCIWASHKNGKPMLNVSQNMTCWHMANWTHLLHCFDCTRCGTQPTFIKECPMWKDSARQTAQICSVRVWSLRLIHNAVQQPLLCSNWY